MILLSIFFENTSLTNYDNYDVLTEAYYGKPKELEEVEKLLVPIIKAIHYEYGGRPELYKGGHLNGKDIYNSREYKEINKLFGKFLKTPNFELILYGARAKLNIIGRLLNTDDDEEELDPLDIAAHDIGYNEASAYASPSVTIKLKSKFKNKPIDPNDLDIKVFVDKNLIHSLELTPSEVIGSMLHEIGHQMNTSWFSIISVSVPPILSIILEDETTTNKIINTAMLGITMVLSKYTVKIRAEMDKIIDSYLYKTPAGKIATRYIQYIQEPLQSIYSLRQMYGLINGTKQFNFKKILAQSLNPSSIFGYSDEKFADSYATAYGYGPALSSTFRKFDMEHPNGFDFTKIPIVNVAYDFTRVTMGMVHMYTDEHPQHITRVYSQIKKLKRELKDPSLPKKYVKEIESQINELEDICEKMMSIRENKERGMVFSALANKIIVKIFKGSIDLRDIPELIWRHEV
jgi:hypothetical protein